MADFLNGDIFGYLLHAAEVLIALALFTVGLKRRRLFPLRVVVVCLLYLALAVGLGLLFERYFPVIRYLCAFLLSLTLIPLCYRVEVWDGLFRASAAAATQNLSYSAAALVAGLGGWDPLLVQLPYAIPQAAVYLALQAVMFFFCFRELKHADADFARERYPLVIVSVILSVVIYVIQLDRRSAESADFVAWQVMFVSFDILLLCMLFGLSERGRLRRENAILDQLRAGEERQYELDRSAMEMINVKCHDLKHRLLALRDMHGEEQARALQDVEKAVNIYDAVVQTGCKPLDLIIKNKVLLCEKYGIRFFYMADGEKLSFMSAVDIYSLFGNALDNAIAASQQVEDESRRLINLAVAARGRLLTIHVENYTAQEPAIGADGLPRTTKADAANHGFGMISMRRTAESYGGVMSVSCKNHIFSLDMTIPIKK